MCTDEQNNNLRQATWTLFVAWEPDFRWVGVVLVSLCRHWWKVTGRLHYGTQNKCDRLFSGTNFYFPPTGRLDFDYPTRLALLWAGRNYNSPLGRLLIMRLVFRYPRSFLQVVIFLQTADFYVCLCSWSLHYGPLCYDTYWNSWNPLQRARADDCNPFNSVYGMSSNLLSTSSYRPSFHSTS